MSKHLLRAFASQDPERFAELLGTSSDVQTTLDILTDIPDGLECDVVSRLTPESSGRLLNSLPDPILIGWLETASVDAGRRMLAVVMADRSTRLIEGISNRSKRRGLRRLTSYLAGSIGELVQTRMVTLKGHTLAADISREIHQQGGTRDGPVVIERSDGTVMGVLNLVELIQNLDPVATASDFCTPVRPIYPDAPISVLENSSEWMTMSSLPVVDHDNLPIGYVTRKALEDTRRSSKDDAPILESVAELTKQFWEVSTTLLTLIFSRGAER